MPLSTGAVSTDAPLPYKGFESCYDSAVVDNFWPNFVSIAGRAVKFDNSVASSKLKRGEKLTAQKMFNITSKLILHSILYLD